MKGKVLQKSSAYLYSEYKLKANRKSNRPKNPWHIGRLAELSMKENLKLI